jgi:hypothetical protein
MRLLSAIHCVASRTSGPVSDGPEQPLAARAKPSVGTRRPGNSDGLMDRQSPAKMTAGGREEHGASARNIQTDPSLLPQLASGFGRAVGRPDIAR